ncbi:hypothetical protein SRHO_G00275830 [Serrasalmus rhombeus]
MSKRYVVVFAQGSTLHSDVDKGDGNVKYVLTGEGASSIFTIDENTGDIHATKRLDREEQGYYTLRAQAVDRETNIPVEDESEFIVKVQDINDNEPKFPDGPYTAGVPEMSPLGTTVVQVAATDADDPTYGHSARVVYSIIHGQPYFSVEPKTDLAGVPSAASLPTVPLSSSCHLQCTLGVKLKQEAAGLFSSLFSPFSFLRLPTSLIRPRITPVL